MRWGLGQATPAGDLPWGTLLANVLGSLALGVVLVAGERVGSRRRHHTSTLVVLWRPFLATGVLGGFTTFSTLVLEVDHLPVSSGLAYLAMSVGLGLGAYAVGNTWARRILGVDA